MRKIPFILPLYGFPAKFYQNLWEGSARNLNGVIIKVEFEKPYDEVKWSFLQPTTRMKRSPNEWCALIQKIVYEASIALKVNNGVGKYFQTKKG
jgi:hypothetical protein